MKPVFKNLLVWQKALDFAVKVIKITESLNSSGKHYRLIEQIEAAAASIPQNIAEGKGRYSKKEFIQYLYISRGSMYETLTLTEIFYRSGWIDEQNYNTIESEGIEIINMLMGLIESIKTD
ncbi:MAG: four helix bundle protein [Bacteroidetes bacterium]|nr:four helix bundle protein [Bacteroidota bacterium]